MKGTGEAIVSLLMAIVGVATVAVVVQSPRTASVITAGGNAFTNSIRAASGR